jgi:hypothetical protein
MYEQLPSRGIRVGDFAPSSYRNLWRLGIPVTPPIFSNFFSVALTNGVYLALGIALPMLVIFCWLQGSPVTSVLRTLLFVGAGYGLFMAAVNWLACRKYKSLDLPPWSEYPRD